MEANTLRIGNYVYDDFKEIHKVEFLSSDEYKNWIKEPNIILSKINGLKGFYQSDEVFPIPISEEWLLNLGFTKHATNIFWFRKKQICISLVGAIELISWDMQIFKIDTKAEHIHQLQNLYFALTNEELTIK